MYLLRLLLFFSSHFSNGEGKAGVITSKKTAPSRVFQRYADIENGSLKTTCVGTWVLCASWGLQFPALLLKRALPVVSILMGTEMDLFWKIKNLQRKKNTKTKTLEKTWRHRNPSRAGDYWEKKLSSTWGEQPLFISKINLAFNKKVQSF